MVVAPVARLVARPEALILAVAGTELLHVAEEVRSCVLPSLYIPVAVNCWLTPMKMDGIAGVTTIELKVTDEDVTVSVAEPLTAPWDALMVVEPADRPVARPALLMLATEVLRDCHVAVAVKS
jgi:hypothetical protein